jgi:hypothetical protein
MLNRVKKFQLNRNFAFYNFDSGVYETDDGRSMSYEEMLRNKWKCEKCSEPFSSFRNLLNHKNDNHSY